MHAAAPGLLILIIAYLVLISLGDLSVPLIGSRSGERRTPLEFLYLDTQRVDSYLGQLTDGNIKKESRTETHKADAGLAFQTDLIGSASASREVQSTKSAVVTLTEADNFYKLLAKLTDDNAIRETSTASLGFVDDLTRPLTGGGSGSPDGMMVKISDVFLRVPPYLSAYYEFRYATFTEPDSEVFESPPLTHFGLAQETAGPHVAAERKRFRERVRGNPRLPCVFLAPGLTVFCPARFVNLTGDISLLHARLTIVGKVVAFSLHGFGDAASEFTYLRGLTGASRQFLRDIGVKGKVLNAPRKERNGLLFRGLERSVTYRGRVVEVIPVAIYS